MHLAPRCLPRARARGWWPASTITHSPSLPEYSSTLILAPARGGDRAARQRGSEQRPGDGQAAEQTASQQAASRLSGSFQLQSWLLAAWLAGTGQQRRASAATQDAPQLISHGGRARAAAATQQPVGCREQAARQASQASGGRESDTAGKGRREDGDYMYSTACS